MSAFTPGPWRASHGNLVRIMVKGSDVVIAGVHKLGRYTGELDNGQVAANAALIAAAPDMLAGLKAQHEALDVLLAMLIERDPSFMPSKSRVWPMLLQGQAAILQAEGR